MTLKDMRQMMQQPSEWNVRGPAKLDATTAAPPNATAIEALKHMRDTTNSREQYDRAVEALRQMGVDHD
jgi:hypothetical protein